MATSLLTRVKARVDLHTSNRARGLIQGRGRSMFAGRGEAFDALKYYQPGDKISDIDWKATARSGEPLIRQFNEERVRHLSIVDRQSVVTGRHSKRFGHMLRHVRSQHVQAWV